MSARAKIRQADVTRAVRGAVFWLFVLMLVGVPLALDGLLKATAWWMDRERRP